MYIRILRISFDHVGRAHGAFGHIIKKNHGIKEENLLEILLPVGISESQLDPLWLADMNAFGTARGDVAHRSGTVYKVIDPHLEFNTVQKLLPGLKKLDELLNKLR